ncbi:hypothetical protein ES703_44273 [subsurface metagenome]
MNIKEKTKRYLLSKFRISYDVTEELFGIGLIEEHRAKKVLIKEEYPDLMREKGHITAKMELSETYFVSSSTIDHYIYRDN